MDLQTIQLTATSTSPADLYAQWETELGVSGTLANLDGDDSNWTFDLASPALVAGASHGEFSSEGMLGWSGSTKIGNSVVTNFDRMYYAGGVQPDMLLGFRFNGDMKSVGVKLQKAAGDTIVGGYIQPLGGGQKLFFAIRLSATLSTPPVFCVSLESGSSNAYVSGLRISPNTQNFSSLQITPGFTGMVGFGSVPLGVYSGHPLPLRSVNNSRAMNPGPPPSLSAPLKYSWKNIHFGGNGTIQGTVTIENIPGARQVRLFDKHSGLLVSEAWSTPDGHYEFNNVATDREYFVVAHDYLRVYNAVVQDMLTP
jgi:hypothetical protein